MDVGNETLIYFGDPLCSWCYGFAPELTQVLEQSDYSFKLVMGGLRPGGTDTLNSMRSFLEPHWVEIEKRSGQPFDYGIFERGEMILDTEPSSRAVVAVRSIAPELEFPLFKAIQQAFYSKRMDTTKISEYQPICEALGIDFVDLERAFESEGVKDRVKEDFRFSAGLGVRGFPTVALKTNDTYYLITNGYQKADQMLDALEQVKISTT